MLIVFQAQAANINPAHIGSECPDGGAGIWHFVNNQTGGAPAGVLTATFADAGTIMTGPDQVNQNTQHFYITGPSGPLTAASTNLPGRLVLSDLECGPGDECRPEPERCDNGVDDDCDGDVDCDDEDCRDYPDCQPPDECRPEPERCDNGVDDDCDGLIDCEDGIDCRNHPNCQ